MPRVQIAHIEDTRKLVDSWIAVGARVVNISEDTEDGILWMTLKSRLGRLQLRRDSYPLSLDAPTHGVWNALDKVPGSPYVVEDNCFARENPEEVRAEYEKLWRKYFDPNWKRLDFLLGERETDDGLGDALLLLGWCVVGLACLLVTACVAVWVFT